MPRQEGVGSLRNPHRPCRRNTLDPCSTVWDGQNGGLPAVPTEPSHLPHVGGPTLTQPKDGRPQSWGDPRYGGGRPLLETGPHRETYGSVGNPADEAGHSPNEATLASGGHLGCRRARNLGR
jgi:hypothetical protein